MKLKKLNIFALMIMLSVSSISVMGQKSVNTAEDKAKIMTEKMTEFLSLSSEQANEIRRINLKFIQKDLEIKSELKSEKAELKAERKEIEVKYDQDILNVLDEKQKLVYQESITEREAKRADKASLKTDN